MATLIRIDRNGTKYYEGSVSCPRCGGAGGADQWKYTGWNCYQCGGSGKGIGSWKEYTPEYEEKLAARRKARQEKWEREHAEEIAERKAAEEARIRAKEEAEAAEKARKAISQYTGQIGDKIDLDVTLERSAWFEIPSFRGFGIETMHVYTFRNANGDALVWKTSKGLNLEEGTKVHLTGTIKDHSEYKEEKQTVLTRCKIK